MLHKFTAPTAAEAAAYRTQLAAYLDDTAGHGLFPVSAASCQRHAALDVLGDRPAYVAMADQARDIDVLAETAKRCAKQLGEVIDDLTVATEGGESTLDPIVTSLTTQFLVLGTEASTLASLAETAEKVADDEVTAFVVAMDEIEMAVAS